MRKLRSTENKFLKIENRVQFCQYLVVHSGKNLKH